MSLPDTRTAHAVGLVKKTNHFQNNSIHIKLLFMKIQQIIINATIAFQSIKQSAFNTLKTIWQYLDTPDLHKPEDMLMPLPLKNKGHENKLPYSSPVVGPYGYNNKGPNGQPRCSDD